MISSLFAIVRRVAVLAAVPALLLVAPPPAQAQDQAFKDAMEARDSKKWPDVIRELRRAIQANAQESTRKIEYGGRLGFGKKNTEYLPHFYLGEALFTQAQQDCVGAVEAWAASEKQNVVRSRADLVTAMQNGYIVCESKGVLPPAKFDPLLQRTSQHYNEVNALASTVSQLGQQNTDQWRAEMREQYDRATQELEAARRQINSGTKTRSQKDFADATAAADRARGILLTVQTNLRSAIDLVQSIQSLARDVDQTLSGIDALDKQIDGRRAALTPQLASVRQQGRDALAKARERYTGGVKASNAAALTEARTLGQDAGSRFKQVLDELGRIERESLGRQLSDSLAAAQQASILLDGLFATLDKRIAANPTLAGEVAGERDELRKAADTVRRRLESATKSENVAGIAAATTLSVETRDRLSTLIAKFGPITLRERGVSEALEEGARQFFAGQYQQSLSTLNPTGASSTDALQLHVHLFRAAALHALYTRSRETDQTLQAQARAEVEECRKIDSAFQPDPRAFSPRFISFFNAGGSAAPATQQ